MPSGIGGLAPVVELFVLRWCVRPMIGTPLTPTPTSTKQVMINDVRRAYFYAPATRDVFIEIPDEDPDNDSSMVGKLNLSLYGTA